MSFPFQRIAHITLDQRYSSYAMELIAVYLLLCLVIIVAFFVIPWVDWQQCESLNSYCCRICCGGGGGSPTAVTARRSGDGDGSVNGATPLDIVISVKPVAGKMDAKLSPTPSYSAFAPPDYDEVAATTATMQAALTSATATTTATSNGTGRMQSRPSRTLMAIFVVELPKCAGSRSSGNCTAATATTPAAATVV